MLYSLSLREHGPSKLENKYQKGRNEIEIKRIQQRREEKKIPKMMKEW